MSFAKLVPKIVTSSLWSEPLHVRVVFVSFLALKDENGFVEGAPSSLQRICNVSIEQFSEAIKILESPDLESTTEDYEGRRIEKIEGGWIVLNHEKYRAKEDVKKEQTRERVRRFREKNKDVTQCNACNVTYELPSVSESKSVSLSVSPNLQSKIEVSKSEEQWNQFKTTYPQNGSSIDPAAEKEFIKLVGSGIDPQQIIKAASEYAEYWKSESGYPYCKHIAQAVNWLLKRQFAVDWVKKLEADKKQQSNKSTGRIINEYERSAAEKYKDL